MHYKKNLNDFDTLNTANQYNNSQTAEPLSAQNIREIGADTASQESEKSKGNFFSKFLKKVKKGLAEITGTDKKNNDNIQEDGENSQNNDESIAIETENDENTESNEYTHHPQNKYLREKKAKRKKPKSKITFEQGNRNTQPQKKTEKLDATIIKKRNSQQLDTIVFNN